jgi:TonB family protein
MKKIRKYLVVASLLLLAAQAYGDKIKDDLKKQYGHKALILRTPFQAGTQEFDSTGKPLKAPPADKWIMHGTILAQKINLDSGSLLIEGPQVAVEPSRKDKSTLIATVLGKPVKVEIRLDHGMTSLDEARELLNKVFVLDDTDVEHTMPEFQRPGVALEKTYKVNLKEAGQDKVTPPVATYAPEPDYSIEAHNDKYQGTVVLGVIIDATGQVAKIRLKRSLGRGLDMQAIEKVKSWRFTPAMKDGQGVPVEVSVEISFHLF